MPNTISQKANERPVPLPRYESQGAAWAFRGRLCRALRARVVGASNSAALGVSPLAEGAFNPDPGYAAKDPGASVITPPGRGWTSLFREGLSSRLNSSLG